MITEYLEETRKICLMTAETDNTRETALSILEAKEMRWERKGSGQRFVVHINQGLSTIRALVKTASRGSAMVRTDIDDADKAKIIGFKDDVSDVLFAVGDPVSNEVSAYLVPIKEVEAAYRSTHRVWKSHHPMGDENTTWVIWFNERGNADCNGFHLKWAHYRIGSRKLPSLLVNEPRAIGNLKHADGLTITQAKQRLALSLGIDPSCIKITIES